MPWPAISGAEPCTGSNSEGNLRSGLMLADGAMPIVPAQAGPRSDRMSPNRLDATTTSNQSGLQHELRGQDVDVVLVGFDVGIVLRHRFDALVPVRHGDGDAVRLGRRRQMLLRRLRASSKANRRTRSTPLRVKTVSCITISRSVPSNIRPPTDGIFALGVLAHDAEIDVAGLAVGQRRRHAGHQPHRAQIDVLVELAAELDQRAPQRNVIGHLRRPADRAEEDRVVPADLVLPVLRHHAPCLA